MTRNKVKEELERSELDLINTNIIVIRKNIEFYMFNCVDSRGESTVQLSWPNVYFESL